MARFVYWSSWAQVPGHMLTLKAAEAVKYDYKVAVAECGTDLEVTLVKSDGSPAAGTAKLDETKRKASVCPVLLANVKDGDRVRVLHKTTKNAWSTDLTIHVTAPAAATPAEWTGDSSQWSQEKKLRSMHPTLRPRVTPIIAALEARGFEPQIFFGWRSVAVQQQLLARGVTTVSFSFHNAQLPDGTPNAYAADIIDRRWGWSHDAEAHGFWQALGQEAATQGLVWGGSWVSFRDWAHVQLVPNGELARVKRESGL